LTVWMKLDLFYQSDFETVEHYRVGLTKPINVIINGVVGALILKEVNPLEVINSHEQQSDADDYNRSYFKLL